MVVSEINGGLGNQMFQYACGRALSLKKNAQLLLDLTVLKKGISTCEFTARPFDLGVFNARPGVSPQKVLNRFFPLYKPAKAFYRWILGYRIYTEPHFNYDSKLITKNRDIYLRGYWQSEKYFIEYETQIRSDFDFLEPVNTITDELQKEMKEALTVSVHVRRGDYVTSPSANSFHGLANLDYYKAAASYVEQFLDAPIYYIFSDDADWVRSNLLEIFKRAVVVDHNHGADSWQDMLLMSSCQHHIIANSSFSWWGAWLNKSADKIVVAPKIWFADEQQNSLTTDLIPASWIRL